MKAVEHNLSPIRKGSPDAAFHLELSLSILICALPDCRISASGWTNRAGSDIKCYFMKIGNSCYLNASSAFVGDSPCLWQIRSSERQRRSFAHAESIGVNSENIIRSVYIDRRRYLDISELDFTCIRKRRRISATTKATVLLLVRQT